MLATGGSAVSALETLRKWGVRQTRLLSIIAAPEGIQEVASCFPETPVHVCAVDTCLNDQHFIVPGLGDAGDRIFNTPNEG
jgi:uracil phosphoribosyltransferase